MAVFLILIVIIAFALLIKGANFLFDAIEADQIRSQQESNDNSRMSICCLVIGVIVFFGGGIMVMLI